MTGEAAVHVVQLKLTTIAQLFNSLDPSPFVGRDLDPNAETFITEWAEEHPTHGEFRLDIQLNHCDNTVEARERVLRAVRVYFEERELWARQDFRRLMREGRLSLVIGLAFLAFCLGISRWLENEMPEVGVVLLLSESLLIGGWVAMWRPMEIFLYKWWPLRRRIRLLQRLARMEVRLTIATA